MLTLKTPKDGDNLSFTINGSDFTKEIKTVTSIFSGGAEFILALDSGKLFVVGSDTTKTCVLELETSECTGSGCFIIDAEVLKVMLTNRDSVKFTMENSQLSFLANKGKYKGDMSIQPAGLNGIEQLNELFKVKVDEVCLPDSVFAQLDKSIKYCGLNDSYAEVNSELVRYIIGNKNRLTIATYDQFHSALLNTKLEKELIVPFKIAVYQSHFDVINKLARGKELTIAISERYFYVRAEHFFISLPPIQYNEDEFNAVHDIIKAVLKQEKTASCLVDVKELSQAITSICSIYESGSKIELRIKGEKIGLNLATSHGSISDSLKVHDSEGFCVANIDAPPLKDVLKCSPISDSTACRFSIVENKAYTMEYKFEGTRLSYMIAVLQN